MKRCFTSRRGCRWMFELARLTSPSVSGMSQQNAQRVLRENALVEGCVISRSEGNRKMADRKMVMLHVRG
ncbi:hypothetical protein Rcae01_06209 [Novipirellula caenicola]|uniref:RNA-binding S4 domain-containing protein n=1 Tax=Novipirellula caenicola TaxID=1536901 RepID=A0ABP9W000_9BACT